ncbi:MAG: hypothetical protein Q9166_006449 [cf. Caloplaca sp. 2 TL-2023]
MEPLWETVSYLRYGRIAPTEEAFQACKDHYRQRRDNFRLDPRSASELLAWKRGVDDYDYQLLYLPYSKSGTFFSEYAIHNPPSLILSETSHSYIIGNTASYDGRQYPLAPTGKRPEGQGYCHTLVIPKTRIYNVVDPDATTSTCFILKEMCTHFLRFWATEEGKLAILTRARKAIEDRDNALINGNSERPSEYDNLTRNAVFKDFERKQHEFMRLRGEDDFLFGFHVFPENSIGHLHMHVFPHDNSFREWSTKDYDYKTVPLQAILEVEEEDVRDGANQMAQ